MMPMNASEYRDSVNMSNDEWKLRCLLCFSKHGPHEIYADDGELQFSFLLEGNIHTIDYVRNSVDEIRKKLDMHQASKWGEL